MSGDETSEPAARMRTQTGQTPPVNGQDADRWLNRGVVSVGAASFFSDTGHEIATAVLPSFVTSVLHASPATLGLIEGASDALAGAAKLTGGPLANDPGRRRRLATGGYLVTGLATGAIGLATAVWQVGLLRALAWTARGARSPARDALLASLVPPSAYGRAFGVERAGDNLGAVAGPLLAALLVGIIGVRDAIYFAVVPGLLAAAVITAAARHAQRQRADREVRSTPRLNLRALHSAGMAKSLLPVGLFELGNVATTLLILRATDLLRDDARSFAAATSLAILLYAAHNAVAGVVAYIGGHWIDRVGPRAVFAVGGIAYVAAYGLFALPTQTWPSLLAAFVLAGTGIGLAETAESTLVAHLLPDQLRGSGFGLLGAVQSVGDFASTATVGLLWAIVSPTAGFIYASAWMVGSVVTSTAQRRGAQGRV